VVGVLLLALPPSAQAGPREREDDLVTQAAILAETMPTYLDRGRKYPRTMDNRRAKRDLGVEVERGMRIVKYKRLARGREYRLCVVHRKGGWATFHSRTLDLKSAPRGAACRY
jgi:hypothetical protein